MTARATCDRMTRMGLHYRGAPCPAADRLAAARDAYALAVAAARDAARDLPPGMFGARHVAATNAMAEVGRCRDRMLLAVDAFRAARDRADAMIAVGLGIWV